MLRRLPRFALNAALFIAAFAVVVWLLRPEYPSDGSLEAKLRHFERHKDEYEVVVFGSSRLHRAFNPAVFEAEMRRRGLRVKAFNFGVGGMRPHEMDALIERVLDLEPARLRYALIELMDWSPSILPSLATHDRTIAWHTPRETLSALRTVWLTDAAAGEKIALSGSHLRLLAARSTNFGEGYRGLRALLGRREVPEARMRRVAAGQGWFAVDEERGPRFRERRRQFLTENYDWFLKEIGEIPQENAEPARLEEFNVRAQVRQQAWLRERGVEPVYVLPNLRWGTPTMHRLGEAGYLDHVVSFNDPRAYPALFDPEHYFDRGHLNRRGAEVFTRLLAEEFAATALREGGGPLNGASSR